MAVVTTYGELAGDAAFKQASVADGAAVYPRGDNRYMGGVVHNYLDKVTIAVGDSATSTYPIAVLPKEAVLLPTSHLRNDAAVVTGNIDIGDVNDVDSIVAAYAGTANTTLDYDGFASGTHTKLGQPLWQLCGYATADAAPAQIELIMTLNTSAQATADADIWVNLQYTID